MKEKIKFDGVKSNVASNYNPSLETLQRTPNIGSIALSCLHESGIIQIDTLAAY